MLLGGGIIIMFEVYVVMYTNINEPQLLRLRTAPRPKCQPVSLRRTSFGQYQASSAAQCHVAIGDILRVLYIICNFLGSFFVSL